MFIQLEVTRDTLQAKAATSRRTAKVELRHLIPSISSAERSDTILSELSQFLYSDSSLSVTGRFPNRAAGVRSNARSVSAIWALRTGRDAEVCSARSADSTSGKKSS